MTATTDDKTQLAFSPERSKVHALIIEDDELIAAAIQDELRALGYESFGVARSEREALVFADRQLPHFITVDAKLEEGSGIEALVKICARQAIPAVVVTGNPFQVLLPGVVTLGKPFSSAAFAVAYEQAISKPFQASELSAA